MSCETFEIYAASGDNSCRHANDGVCNVPQYCDVSTDATDCGGEFYQGRLFRVHLWSGSDDINCGVYGGGKTIRSINYASIGQLHVKLTPPQLTAANLRMMANVIYHKFALLKPMQPIAPHVKVHSTS